MGWIASHVAQAGAVPHLDRFAAKHLFEHDGAYCHDALINREFRSVF
jgi:hypothetical protein